MPGEGDQNVSGLPAIRSEVCAVRERDSDT